MTLAVEIKGPYSLWDRSCSSMMMEQRGMSRKRFEDS